MSWSATVGATAPEDFDAAVDECPVTPVEQELADGPKAQLAAAREAAKELAGALGEHGGDGGDRLPITANLAGHANEGAVGVDSISVSLREVAPEVSV